MICHRDTEGERVSARSSNELLDINKLTEKIIGCAIEVHKNLGPGLLESIYENALCFELDANKIFYDRQVIIPVLYKKQKLGEHRLDLLIEDKVIIEIKAVDRFDSVFKAQL